MTFCENCNFDSYLMALHIVIPNSIKALKGVVKKRNDTNLNEKKKLTIFFSEVRFCLLLAF